MHEDEDFPDHLHLAPGETAHDVDGIESLSLTSVGIDIGSSTSHLVFSHLILRRRGADLSTRFEVSQRDVLYRSPILLTPYTSATSIDVEALRAFFDTQYRQAGLTPASIDTGAVVITGEALNKENARPIAELFAQHSGKFICASAGPNHEALLAAHGCGAVALSKAANMTVLNLDVGGGTTKLALIRGGAVVSTAAVSVGARLLAFDPEGRVARVEPPVRLYLGRDVEPGALLDEEVRSTLAAGMADVLLRLMDGHLPAQRALMVTPEGLADYGGLSTVDCLVFSGGVAEYIYQHDRSAYGDLGPLLGEAIRERLKALPVKLAVREPAEGIRATVIGAGEYTIQASGMTSCLSDLDALPAFGLQVLRPLPGQPLASALAKFDLASYGPGLALALSIDGQTSYPRVRAIAEEIAQLVGAQPLFLLLDADVAKSLGGILKEELHLPGPVIAVDGIDVGDLDYVDIGRPLGVSESVPVTVKSLMFPRG